MYIHIYIYLSISMSIFMPMYAYVQAPPRAWQDPIGPYKVCARLECRHTCVCLENRYGCMLDNIDTRQYS